MMPRTGLPVAGRGSGGPGQAVAERGSAGSARGRRRAAAVLPHPGRVRRRCGGGWTLGCMVITLLDVPGVDRDRNRGVGCCGAGPRAASQPPARRVPGGDPGHRRRGAGARDEMETRLWPLGSGDSRLDDGAALVPGRAGGGRCCCGRCSRGRSGGDEGSWESMRRLWRGPPAAARGVGSLFRQMGVSELPGCLRWEGE